MRLTKFVHSCVLVEDGGKAVLFDPGVFSWNSGLIDVYKLPEIQWIVVSHQHSDHFDTDFAETLVKRFPEAIWFAPKDAHGLLKDAGATNVTNESSDICQIDTVNHAPVEPFGVQVQDLVTHWHSKVTHPGDTHNLRESKEVLLLPVQAPWGTTVRAVQLALELKPKFILPIHDWMWNDKWREISYDRFETIFSKTDIKFLRPTNGEPIEIKL